jgi:hypothetical protein
LKGKIEYEEKSNGNNSWKGIFQNHWIKRKINRNAYMTMEQNLPINFNKC